MKYLQCLFVPFVGVFNQVVNTSYSLVEFFRRWRLSHNEIDFPFNKKAKITLHM